MLELPIIDIQLASVHAHVPALDQLNAWAMRSLLAMGESCVELTLRIVDEDEMRALNSQYRKKSGTTNVLSFPADCSDELDIPLLGDIVICTEVVYQEALAQEKPLDAHWAHMIVHGILHLLGNDHEKDDEAEEMEDLERNLLTLLGFKDPYE